MIIIRFADEASKRRALGYLAGRFSFKSWSTGEVMVPAAACTAAQSPAPKTIPIQGRLTDANGVPKPDGSYSLVFRLYNDADPSTPVWSDAKTVTVKSAGLMR